MHKIPQPLQWRGPGIVRQGLSVRARVLAAVSLLSLLSLILAGVVAYTLERQRIDDTIDANLRLRAKQAQELTAQLGQDRAASGVNSNTDLVRTLTESLGARGEVGILGMIDGRVVATGPPTATLRPEGDPEFITEIQQIRHTGSKLGTISTDVTTYRCIFIQVTTPGDPAQGLIAYCSDLEAEHAQLDSSYATYVIVGMLSVGLIGLVAWLVIGQLLEPITWVRQTAREISETDLSQRIPVRGHDDLAGLTRTVNDMLDRLESTFEAQRELYDDVGHELRTPLTILRGHLELMDPEDPNEVVATRDRALSEINRMTRLVGDLITLAKSERPDFIQPTMVDVGMLTDETLEKATALGDRRWSLDAIADVRCELDHQRIEQALLEMARNAVKFSEPGSTIAMGSSLDGETVRLWVRDQGVGIPADRISAVQERFVRGSQRNIEGSGLGLAIVSSIAAGHGGTLQVKSTSGIGTTITLVLPRRGPIEDFDADPDQEDQE